MEQHLDRNPIASDRALESAPTLERLVTSSIMRENETSLALLQFNTFREQ